MADQEAVPCLYEQTRLAVNLPRIRKAQFIDDGRRLLVRTESWGLRNQSNLGCWDCATGRFSFDISADIEHRPCLGWSCNARFLVIDDPATKSVIAWDRLERRNVGRASYKYDACEWVDVSNSGTFLAVSGQETITLWNISNDEVWHEIARERGDAGYCRFSHDERFLISGRPPRVIDIDSGETLHVLRTKPSPLKFSPDGRLLLTTCWLRGRLWDLHIGQKYASFVGRQEIRGACFDETGDRLAVGEFLSGVAIWNLRTDRFERRLAEGVVPLDLHSAGGRLVALDRALSLWDVPGERELVRFAMFNQDGDWITITSDGYYDGSDDLELYVEWQIDGQPVPFAEYEREFHRPERIEAALMGQERRS